MALKCAVTSTVSKLNNSVFVAVFSVYVCLVNQLSLLSATARPGVGRSVVAIYHNWQAALFCCLGTQ